MKTAAGIALGTVAIMCVIFASALAAAGQDRDQRRARDAALRGDCEVARQISRDLFATPQEVLQLCAKAPHAQ